MASLTMALLTMALLTMALLTMALLTMALLTMALLTMAEPRLFMPDSTLPGCTFTRSLGDRLGKVIGVSAEPEVYEVPLDPRVAYIMLCSDGITDYINDQVGRPAS
jgi:hypothetical protein